MESFIEKCEYCNGSGYIDYDLNKTHIPYEQHLIEEDCDNCSGQGYIKNNDHIIEKIDDMIHIFKWKMKVNQRLIPELRSGYLNELADKYEYQIDTYSRAIGRLQNYKKKFL